MLVQMHVILMLKLIACLSYFPKSLSRTYYSPTNSIDCTDGAIYDYGYSKKKTTPQNCAFQCIYTSRCSFFLYLDDLYCCFHTKRYDDIHLVGNPIYQTFQILKQTNIASVDKVTTQFLGNSANPASLAVDGSSTTFSKTGIGLNPWWSIDLGQSYYTLYIIVHLGNPTLATNPNIEISYSDTPPEVPGDFLLFPQIVNPQRYNFTTSSDYDVMFSMDGCARFFYLQSITSNGAIEVVNFETYVAMNFTHG